MKLQKIHLFIILLLALVFCGCLGGFLQEGMSSSQQTYTGSEGNSATVTTGPDGNTVVTGQNNNTNDVDDNYSSNTYTGPAGNSATVMSGTSGSAVVANTNNSSSGIAYSDIPAGQQDLYILKSQIVPPVCPACPPASACPRQEACPPCPACERCPEPAFECKKVPNYASSNENYLPRPVMADFSQFGM
jgi:uncharacterized protein YdeI (BOF family)